MVTRNKQCHCVVKDIILLFVFSEGGTPPLENHNPFDLFSNIGMDPPPSHTPLPPSGKIQNYTASSSEEPLKWRFVGRPMVASCVFNWYRFSYILARPDDTSSRSRSFALWVASGIRLVTFNYRAPVVTEFIVINSKK